MKGTNILELATFAAIGVMAWFLVMMNNPDVNKNLTNDEISALVEEAKDSILLEEKGDLHEVVLFSKYTTNDDSKLKYSWSHMGSFKAKEEGDKEGIYLNAPIQFTYVWVNEDEENKDEKNEDEENVTNITYDHRNWIYPDGIYNYDFSDQKWDVFADGHWTLEEVNPNWIEIDAPAYKGKWNTEEITIELGVGVHVFTCNITNEKTGATNGENETVVVVVEGPEEVDVEDSNSGLDWRDASPPPPEPPTVEPVEIGDLGLLSK